MATDPRKRQKQLARKNARRKEKKHQLIRHQNISLADRLTAAARFPVLQCWMSDSIELEGIGWVALSRAFPNGEVAVASFLVDRFCLGVKNCFGQFMSRTAYEDEFVRKLKGEIPSYLAPPSEARKFIEAAVAYARSLGLQPHPEYAKAMCLFGDINPAESDTTFEFGKDGKPFFIAGPNDTPSKCRQVVSILTSKLGPDGFEYVLPMAGGDFGRIIDVRGGEPILSLSSGSGPAHGEWPAEELGEDEADHEEERG